MANLLESERLVTFIGLNPSTADDTHDDPTVRRIAGYARSWGFGGFLVVNLFALRSTEPTAVEDAFVRGDDPVGPRNDETILRAARKSELVVAAWGSGAAFSSSVGLFARRVADARRLLDGVAVHAIGLTRSGQPRHPLYARKNLRFVRYEWPEATS